MNTARQYAEMSERVKAIRTHVDDINSTLKSSDWHDVEKQLCDIKVECHVLREYLKNLMPTLTDEKIV